MTNKKESCCILEFDLAMINFSKIYDGKYEKLMITRQAINWCKNLLNLSKARLRNKNPIIAEILYLEALGYYECNLLNISIEND